MNHYPTAPLVKIERAQRTDHWVTTTVDHKFEMVLACGHQLTRMVRTSTTAKPPIPKRVRCRQCQDEETGAREVYIAACDTCAPKPNSLWPVGKHAVLSDRKMARHFAKEDVSAHLLEHPDHRAYLMEIG